MFHSISNISIKNTEEKNCIKCSFSTITAACVLMSDTRFLWHIYASLNEPLWSSGLRDIGSTIWLTVWWNVF